MDLYVSIHPEIDMNDMRKTLATIVFVKAVMLQCVAQDYNGNGFEAYKQQKFQEAYDLFKKSTIHFPDNHFGWYNLARTTSILNADKDPDDPCDVGNNWEFEVLSYLTQAYNINPDGVVKLLTRQETYFDPFKKKASFRKWLTAARFPLMAGTNIETWLTSSDLSWVQLINSAAPDVPDYIFKSDGTLVKSGMFETEVAGKWTVEDGNIRVTSASVDQLYTINLDIAAVDSGGKNKFHALYLRGSAQSNDFPDLVLGPRYGDCGQYNF